jgi:hypothetical protein
LKQEIEINIPYSTFDRNFRDFRDKHDLGESFVYSINSDGKFRAELKESPEDEGYLIRISGWKEEKDQLLIRKVYCPQFLRQYDYVCDFLDLLEIWAMDHKGCFYFEYVDLDEPCMDAYCIRKGLEKDLHLTDIQLEEILEQWKL